MKAKPFPGASMCPETSSRASRRRRVSSITALIALVCFGTTSCTKTQVALSSAGIAAAVVGTTIGITLAVQHSHHTLQGCIYSDADGLKLRTSDAKVYTIKGETADIKVGDKLKLHGSKEKKIKGAPAVDQVFLVEKLNKDYGPCAANAGVSATR